VINLSCMIEVLLIALLGGIVGLVVGLLPGMGTSFILVAAYPILIGWPVEWLLMFYTSVTTSSQFAGSVSALVFGVIGEITGQPAMQERAYLHDHINTAIDHTAQASLIAVFISFVVVALLWNILPQFVYVLRNEVKVVILIAFVLLCIVWGGNRLYANTIMITSGATIGLIGYNYAGTSLLTFNMPWLHSGIPLLPLLTGLVVVPAVVKFAALKFQPDITTQPGRWPLAAGSVMRGSMIGSLVGLVPVIGNAITSQLAWRAEKHYYTNNSVRHSLNRLTSAESANNSGNVTVLLPLLMFGLPIVSSEMILYNMLSSQGWTHSTLTIGTVTLIAAAAVIAAVLSWYLCGPAIKHLVKWTQSYIRQISLAAIAIAAGSVLYSGYQSYNVLWYLTVLAISCLIGLFFRKLDMSPLLVAYLVAPQLLTSAIIVSQLYF
jgi:putative tricarboxylic transport membrane protein